MTIDKVVYVYEDDGKQYFICELSNHRFSIFKYMEPSFKIKLNPNNKHVIKDKKYLCVENTYPITGTVAYRHLSSWMKCYQHIKEDDVMFIIMQHT